MNEQILCNYLNYLLEIDYDAIKEIIDDKKVKVNEMFATDKYTIVDENDMLGLLGFANGFLRYCETQKVIVLYCDEDGNLTEFKLEENK